MSAEEEAYYKERMKNYDEAKQSKFFTSSNWAKFKQNRHKVKTDEERRYESNKKYNQYQPKEDSNMHEKNRGYTQDDIYNSWTAYMSGFNPFKI